MHGAQAATSPCRLRVVTRIFQIISEKNDGYQLDQFANTHSRIWILDDPPQVVTVTLLYPRPLRTFTVQKVQKN